MASAHLEARKELGKHFICSRLETHPTRPGNLALAPEWGLCMPPPPSRPGCGYWGLGGGEASRTMSLAERQGPPSHTPGPRPESFRPEEPSSPSSPAHLEATPQSQPVEGSQRSQARPQLAPDLQVSSVSGPRMSPSQTAASPMPQGRSLRRRGETPRDVTVALCVPVEPGSLGCLGVGVRPS